MVKNTYDAEHAHRLQQVDRTHLHTKALHELAVEAVKYHDKYMSVMEKLMSCLLDNSDCMEEMRKRFDEDGQGITPTYEVTGAVASAFNNYKSSVQVKSLRDILCKLADVSTIAKRNAKVTRSKIEEFGTAAKKRAKRSACENTQKLAQATGKKREKVMRERRADEEQMASMDAAVEESVKSLCGWWAEQLALEAKDLYRAHRDVGVYLARCHEDVTQLYAPPPLTLPRRAQNHLTTYLRADSPEFGGGAMPVARDDTSSYIGVSDYLGTQPSQLPPKEVRHGARTDPDCSSPPALYAPVCTEAPPTHTAPRSECSVRR